MKEAIVLIRSTAFILFIFTSIIMIIYYSIKSKLSLKNILLITLIVLSFICFIIFTAAIDIINLSYVLMGTVMIATIGGTVIWEIIENMD